MTQHIKSITYGVTISGPLVTLSRLHPGRSPTGWHAPCTLHLPCQLWPAKCKLRAAHRPCLCLIAICGGGGGPLLRDPRGASSEAGACLRLGGDRFSRDPFRSPHMAGGRGYFSGDPFRKLRATVGVPIFRGTEIATLDAAARPVYASSVSAPRSYEADHMSWDKTYSHTVLLGVDRLGAALLYNEPDITISSLCWIVRNRTALKIAEDAFPRLKLNRWQLWSLTLIGDGLEHFWPGHCEAARFGDLQTSQRTRDLLSDDPPGYRYE